MKYFSLFSGVNGMDMKLPKKFECIGFSEIDKYASMVLKYHYPKIKNYGDIKRIKWETVADFDLLTGGSPCQDFSIAGKRRGLSGAKSSLAWEYIRCLRSKKPKYFLWENVKGVMSSRSGWDFANLLCAFSESGYSLWWQVLNAKDFGIPQNRERIFVIGVRDGCAKEIFFERQDTEAIKIVGSTIGDENTRRGERDVVYSDEGIMGGLKATDYKQPPQIMTANNPKHSNDRVYKVDGIAPTLNSMQGGNRQPFIVAERGRPTMMTLKRTEYGKKIRKDYESHKIKEQRKNIQQLEPRTDEMSNTLTSNQKDNYVYDGKIRKLMPIECERLMSWPDDWTRWGTDEKGKKIEISDSQRYKMCGNGVVSNVVKEIAKNLL